MLPWRSKLKTPAAIPDEELVKGCIANDRYYQEALYRRFFDTMFGMCLRYTEDREEALIILNGGFLRVYQKLHLYSFQGSFEGWIRRVIFHSLSDYFRQQKKGIYFLEIDDQHGTTANEAPSQLYAEDLIKLVEMLPPATQEVFRLFAIEGYSHAEIAERMNISEGTSKWHLSEARKRLKDLLDKQDRIHYAKK